MAAKHFIAAAIKHPGALHRQLGVPEGQKIPAGKLASAASTGGKLGERARFAEMLKGLRHRASGGNVEPDESYLVGEKGPETLKLGKHGGHISPIKHGLAHSLIAPHISPPQAHVLPQMKHPGGQALRDMILGKIKKAGIGGAEDQPGNTMLSGLQK